VGFGQINGVADKLLEHLDKLMIQAGIFSRTWRVVFFSGNENVYLYLKPIILLFIQVSTILISSTFLNKSRWLYEKHTSCR
jgi:hypothetical protein